MPTTASMRAASSASISSQVVMPPAALGAAFLLSLVLSASMMPVDELPPASAWTCLGLGVVSAFFDNIDESGLYSHFTRATPTPALSLPTAEQHANETAAAELVTALDLLFTGV